MLNRRGSDLLQQIVALGKMGSRLGPALKTVEGFISASKKNARKMDGARDSESTLFFIAGKDR